MTDVDDEETIDRLLNDIQKLRRQHRHAWMAKNQMRTFARQVVKERDAERTMVEALICTIVDLMASRGSAKLWRAAVVAAQAVVGNIKAMRTKERE